MTECQPHCMYYVCWMGELVGLEIPERIKFHFEIKLMATLRFYVFFFTVNRCYLFAFFIRTRTESDLGWTNSDGTRETIYWLEVQICC